jgi:hypothetical protein
MRTAVIPKSRELAAKAEQQMRMWATSLQVSERLAEAKPLQQLIHPYVAISREAGIDADGVGKAVAQLLGWQSLDREVLDYLAKDRNWTRFSLECVDERPVSSLRDSLGKWIDKSLVTQAEFLHELAHVFVLAAQHASTVFVGRGAQFILPREAGLAVRLVASKNRRAGLLMAERGVDRRTAMHLLEQTDRDRAEFVRGHYHRDVADPTIYDLVINLDHLSSGDATELIVECARLRFGSEPTAA